MTVHEDTGRIPQWTQPDRLRKARELAGYSQAALADATGISRASIQNYESGKSRPSRPVLLSWALACGISHAWLCHDDYDPCLTGPGKPVTAGQGVRARRGLNEAYVNRPFVTPLAIPAAA
jgi:transcriptional regulator with XRE-family HTH domain